MIGDEGVLVAIPFAGVLVNTSAVKVLIRNGYGLSGFCFRFCGALHCIALLCFAFMPNMTLLHMPYSLATILVECARFQ